MGKVRRCGSRCHRAKKPRCRCFCAGFFHGVDGAGAANREALVQATEAEQKLLLEQHGFKEGETAYIEQKALLLEVKNWGRMIKQIPVKLPESFEEALGYPGKLKWCAFYWEPCGDEAMYDDGICSGDGNWWGFLQFVRHPSVVPWLANCDLGSSDSEASHLLLCDLESREVYVGEKGDVRTFLHIEARKVLPKSPAWEVSPDEIKELHADIFTAFREVMKRLPTPSMTEVEEKMRRDQEAVEKMVAELGGKEYA